MRLLGLALIFGCSLTSWGQGSGKRTHESQRTVLVELFTSEGCSSCPPADALLRRLNGTKTDDGALIIGLGEHVTYWNGLGWRDRFSAETYTVRQQAYGDRFRLDSAYTPQVVVNGETQVVGSDEGALLRAVRAAGKSAVELEIGRAELQGDRIALSYVLRGPVPADSEVWAAVADDRAETEVKRGENGGRVLEHAAVARSLTNLGGAKTGAAMVSLSVPPVLAGQEGVGRHIVVFVQKAGAGPVLAVESRTL